MQSEEWEEGFPVGHTEGATFAEFFAGIGLVRMALEEIGWPCIFANDIDEKKAAIYRTNFADGKLVVKDVHALHPSEVPPAVLATASFPCIDLSLAGNRAGLNGKHSGAFWAFASVLDGLIRMRRHPRAVLIENVTGFLTSGDGADFRDAVAELNRLGYRCDVVVLNAAQFVPQSRPRVFVIGLRDRAPGNPMRQVRALEGGSLLRPPIVERLIRQNPELRWGRIDLPDPPHVKTRLPEVLEVLPPHDPRWWSPDRVARLVESMRPLHRTRMEGLRQSRMPAYGTVYRRTRDGKAVAEVRTDEVAGCLRTARGGSSKQFLVVGHRGQIRVRNMTPREYARLQGVPDQFEFGSDTNLALSSFGDAVCVPAVRWLIESALSPLRDAVARTADTLVRPAARRNGLATASG